MDLFRILLVIILLYLIYWIDSAPITSRKGEKTMLHHGGIVSARWKEKYDKKGTLTFLWIFLICVLLSSIDN